MSSLSRRACFKCGNVGHYAGEPPRALVALLPWDTRGRLSQDGPLEACACVARARAVRHGLWKDTRLTYRQRCARRLRGYATTVGPTPPPPSTITDPLQASSPAMSPTDAPTRAPPRRSSATTARALVTSKPTARLCA
jgi:hypothetical protein